MELLRSTSRGGFSVRSIFTFVLTALVTVLLGAIFVSAPASAAPSGDAHWKGESIVYSGAQYFPADEAKRGESHGLEEGTKYYVWVEQISERPLVRKAHVIYFAPGSDPPTATSANYVVYDYSADREFSNPTGRQSVKMVPAGESTSGAASSCSVDGVGWFICPVTVFLAEAMDNIFKLVAGFVAVQPLVVNDTSSPLYVSWNVMRSIANIAFIIAFLIIIYSQLTGWGVSNYGLKKLLPRLVVAAVLVNISFYITAIAVDLSNLAGFGLQQILINIRENTFAITNETWAPDATNAWSTLTAVILSGGAVTAGWIGLAGATGGSLTAALYLLLPLLAALVLTILFVLLILAARQAIIVILVVIAPLAFVANLLPNTEKWFDRWKDLFMTMLIFFPAFSLVFGGSQLAGGIIIQNASNIIMMIFGMAVQIAPLVITPLLLKLSGGLLGRIAGILNDPRKGALDRTKNWAGDRAAMHRARSMQSKTPATGLNFARRTAQRMDINRRYVKRATDAYEAGVEASALDADQDRSIVVAGVQKSADLRKGVTENTIQQTIQQEINTRDSRMHLENARLEAGKLALERTVQITSSDIAEYKAGHRPAGVSPDLAASIARLDGERQALSIEKTRASNAESVQHDRLADALINNEALRIRAGGIDEHGADASLAAAINTVRTSYGQSISEARQIIKHFNLSSSQRQKLALGETVEVEREDGTKHTFTANDLFAREAAIEDQMATGTVTQIEELVTASGKNAKLAQFRTTIAEGVAKNGLGAKTLYLGGKTIDDIAQGRFNNQEDLMAAVVETIGKGKISEKDLANIDQDAVRQLSTAARRIMNNDIPAGVAENLIPDLRRRAEQFSKVAQDTLINDERVNVKPNAKEWIEEIAKLTNPDFEEPPLPRQPDNQ